MTIVPNNYGVKRRVARIVPFGYKAHPDNKEYLVPVPLELEALKKARDFIKENYTWRSVREWVQKATGRKISLMGLYKIIKDRNDF